MRDYNSNPYYDTIYILSEIATPSVWHAVILEIFFPV